MCPPLSTVNSEFLARVLFSRSFTKIKSLGNDETRLCHLLIKVNHALVTNFEFRKYVF